MSSTIDEYRPSHSDEPHSLVALAPNPAALPPEEPYHPTPLTALPVVLFLATCYTTYRAGQIEFGDWLRFGEGSATSAALIGLWYAGPLMFILLCHEFGHFLQARRYHVSASWPYFIPVPIGPLGTMGAVIGMRGHMGNRKALFDIGISGPLAGLVPALVCSVVGLHMSRLVVVPPDMHAGSVVGAPLLFQWLGEFILGPRAHGVAIDLHPLAFAGWVGIFITALNLIPIGQLDGGHVLYALLRTKAHFVAQLLLMAAILGVIVTGNTGWLLMLVLLMYIGPNHPPTANDDVPLGAGRTVLGWLTLLFIIVGFTPTPFF